VPKAATILKKTLESAERVGMLGVGSELRADDAAGILVALRIKELTAKKKLRANLKIFIGATAPENLTGQIKKFRPTHLIIIDAADLGIKPGEIKIMNPDEISGITFCTHSLPLKVMTDYLLDSFKFSITVIGIQPKTLEVGASPSKAVLKAVDRLSESLSKLIL
jgi:hydrogenase 3 maturation protease